MIGIVTILVLAKCISVIVRTTTKSIVAIVTLIVPIRIIARFRVINPESVISSHNEHADESDLDYESANASKSENDDDILT